MKTATREVRIKTYQSEVDPRIVSDSEFDGETLAWADGRPAVYAIVKEKKSKVFGRGSYEHMGWAQTSTASGAVIERISTVMRALDVHPAGNIFHERARFALEHYGRKGFTGGFFQEHCLHDDGKIYARYSLTLDYTHETLEKVIDRFVSWCDGPNRYPGRQKVTLDGRAVRTFGT